MKDIWQTLPAGFFALAPMDDVSDSVFRRLLTQYGAPDLFFTEFISARGVVTQSPHCLLKLAHQPDERPLIAQLWGACPEDFYLAAQLLRQQGGFAGIDINMGCPKRQLTRKGCCAALMRNPQLALELVAACVEGGRTLPVSVKTRIGWSAPNPAWLQTLLLAPISALTIHYRLARPAKEGLNHPDHPLWLGLKGLLPKALADGPADFRLAVDLLAFRQRHAPQVRLVANGGIFSPSFPGALPPHDGWMVGRAALENPLFFAQTRGQHLGFGQWSAAEQLAFALKHLRQHRSHYYRRVGEARFPLLKRFIKSYLGGQPCLPALLNSGSYEQMEEILSDQLRLRQGDSP